MTFGTFGIFGTFMTTAAARRSSVLIKRQNFQCSTFLFLLFFLFQFFLAACGSVVNVVLGSRGRGCQNFGG
jgi:hypothetical protein|tara:strand:+ start:1053 stop:1265 length:213 start_codon:yes stop_codon:yes gene_type:complete